MTCISPILTTVEEVVETTTLLEQGTQAPVKFQEFHGTAQVERTTSHLQAVWSQVEASRSLVPYLDRLMLISRSKYTETHAFLISSSNRRLNLART